MRFCTECRTNYTAEFNFCLQCGKSLIAPLENKKSNFKPNNKPTGIISAFFIAILIVAAVFALAQSFDRTKPNQPRYDPPASFATHTPSPEPMMQTTDRKKRTPQPTPEATPAPIRRREIYNQTRIVAARGFVWIPFQAEATAQVQGEFSAKGGSNDIAVLIIPADELDNYKSRRSFQTFYTSNGFSTGEQISTDLEPGDYFLILDNRQSLFTSKTVTARFYLTEDE